MSNDFASLVAQHNQREHDRDANAYIHWMGVETQLHPEDDIFRFFYQHPDSLDPVRDYLADGWRTLVELMALLEQVQRPLLQVNSLLEFACGHGRFTRHLVRFLPADRITVSEVVPGATEFVARQFGVQGLVSSSTPERLPGTRRFEVIFVLSLFSHLPNETWGRWLAALYERLQPGGLLVFSTHGAGFADKHQLTLNQDGYFFVPESESQVLDGHEYGVCVTSRAYVERQISQLPEATLRLVKPDYFWCGQDAWVIEKST